MQVAQRAMENWRMNLIRHNRDGTVDAKTLTEDSYIVKIKDCHVAFWVKPIYPLWLYRDVKKHIFQRRWVKRFDNDGLVFTDNETGQTLKFKFLILSEEDEEKQAKTKTTDNLNTLDLEYHVVKRSDLDLRQFPERCAKTNELLLKTIYSNFEWIPIWHVRI
jgi:hypothetical protein